jgi:Sulfotransferase domain
MAKIVWLASYPKSGNTWMRVLLANYLRDGDAPVDINEIGIGPIASARACFDEWAGIEASALDDDLIEDLRPGVFRCLLREAADTLYMKVHDAWWRTRRGEPLFPSDITEGVVYLLRNPLDVAPSCAHHWGVSVEKAVENLCDPAFAISRSRDGLADQLRQRLLSWSGHADSWLDKSGLRVHLVRYEDLRRDPETVFGGVVRFCGLPWDAARIGKAVAFSDFSELQRQEQCHGFRERPLRASATFFRKGRVGAWREEMPDALAERIIQVHGEAMRRFGYMGETGKSHNNTNRKGVTDNAARTQHAGCALF